jgi:hypothetical protein
VTGKSSFAAVNYFDGQGLMVRKKLGVSSAKELNGASVCTQRGTTTELNLADYFRANNLTYEIVAFATSDETFKVTKPAAAMRSPRTLRACTPCAWCPQLPLERTTLIAILAPGKLCHKGHRIGDSPRRALFPSRRRKAPPGLRRRAGRPFRLSLEPRAFTEARATSN